MTTQNRITGIIQLTRPMHVASPEESTTKKNFTATVKTPFAVAGGVYRFPYFPGNDLRGRLRTKAAKLVLDHISVNGKVSLELYAGLMSGSITNSPESDLSAEEALRARDNPYMGLFGGGTRLLRSRYRASDMIPVHPYTIAVGAVPETYADLSPQRTYNNVTKAIDPRDLTMTTTIFKKDHVSTVARPDEIEAYVEDAVAAVGAYQARVLDARAEIKADKARAEAIKEAIKAGTPLSDVDAQPAEQQGTKRVGLQNWLEYEAIIAGTPLYFQIDFDNDTHDAHIGLALMSLKALVREQGLGGIVRTGLGQFRADLKLTRQGETMPIFVGNWAGADAEFAPAVEDLVSTACDGLKKLSADEMMAFFVPRQVKADDAKKAKGKSKKPVAEVE